MKKIIFCFLWVITAAPLHSMAQEGIRLNLYQVIELAAKQSPQAKVVSTTFKNRYWTYRRFQSNYLPQLRLNSTLPDLVRSYQRITLNDGSDAFLLRTLSNSSLNMSLSQGIGLTGGTVFMRSDVQRIDLFGNQPSISYLASPMVVGISQPLSGFNNLSWDRKIEPMRYEEARKQFSEEMELVSIEATERYFNLLLAQINFDIQQKNVANNDTLYKISQGRYNLGKIAENDLLQMELSAMNARNNLAQAALDMELGMLQLKIYLNLKGEEKIELAQPGTLPGTLIDENKALGEAIKNRSQIVAFQRQRAEADRELARAKAERWNINLFGSYGYVQTGPNIESAYRSPLSQQQLSIGVDIPLLDWGRTKAGIETAKANKELMETTLSQAEQNFKQDVLLAVKQVNMYRQKALLSAKADTIAQKRYDISVNRYLIGKISIIDLNIATQEKDQARQEYIQSLRTFWNSWFELRRKTLYDFELNQPIQYDLSTKVKR
jgi:outer membrane protein